jgi:hypothetical protein
MPETPKPTELDDELKEALEGVALAVVNVLEIIASRTPGKRDDFLVKIAARLAGRIHEEEKE